MRGYSGGTLVEAQKLQCLSGEVDDGTLLSGSNGKIQIAEVPVGDIGKDGIVAIRGGVENGRIDVVERWWCLVG